MGLTGYSRGPQAVLRLSQTRQLRLPFSPQSHPCSPRSAKQIEQRMQRKFRLSLVRPFASEQVRESALQDGQQYTVNLGRGILSGQTKNRRRVPTVFLGVNLACLLLVGFCAQGDKKRARSDDVQADQPNGCQGAANWVAPDPNTGYKRQNRKDKR